MPEIKDPLPDFQISTEKSHLCLPHLKRNRNLETGNSSYSVGRDSAAALCAFYILLKNMYEKLKKTC